MNKNIIYLGTRYYSYDENGNIVQLRIVKDFGGDVRCSVIDPDGKKYKTNISKEELSETCERLRPDGIIYFNIVNCQDIEDVMVLLYRKKDFEQNKQIPYAVCRQNITDIFANTLMDKQYEDIITGVAVSEDSLPESVSMETVLSCDGISYSIGVAIYIDDTIMDILSFIKPKKFDTVLHNLFMSHIKYKYKDTFKKYMKDEFADGYCKSLVNLLKGNNFMYEFYTGFNIIPTPAITDKEIENKALSLSHQLLLSNIIMKKIDKTLLIPYDRTIDLEKIERDYILIRDGKNKTYIVAYTHNGPMDINVGDIESEENIQKLSKLPGYANNEYIQKYSMIETFKYSY